MVLMHLTDQQKKQALALARLAIRNGVQRQQKTKVELAGLDEIFQQQACCFVTLKKQGKLRGCIGSLQAYQPLAKDIAEHAYGAAFNDPRFSALQANELDEINISISILTPQQKLSIASQQELLAAITAGVDGLTLEDGFYKATFLPAVWEQLPNKQEFLLHLKRKAGMPDNYWSDTLTAYHYQTISFSEAE